MSKNQSSTTQPVLRQRVIARQLFNKNKPVINSILDQSWRKETASNKK